MEGRRDQPHLTREEAIAVFQVALNTRDVRAWSPAQVEIQKVSGRKRNPKTVKGLLRTAIEFLRRESEGGELSILSDDDADCIAQMVGYDVRLKRVQRWFEWFWSYRQGPRNLSPQQRDVMARLANTELAAAVQEHLNQLDLQIQQREMSLGRRAAIHFPGWSPNCSEYSKQAISDTCQSDPRLTSLTSAFQLALEEPKLDQARSLMGDIKKRLRAVLELGSPTGL